MGIEQSYIGTQKIRAADPDLFVSFRSSFKRLSQTESYDTIYKCFTASIHRWS